MDREHERIVPVCSQMGRVLCQLTLDAFTEAAPKRDVLRRPSINAMQ